MLRCIQLAENGLGNTYPNPLVGSVIVYKNKIIGEGWHYQSGMPHAEVNAIASVKNQSLIKDSTIYVSLEPCSHFGKTPPCANLIIEKGIKTVIIGSMDPNPKVAGNGIKFLKDHGSNVVERVLEKECNKLNKRFFTFFQKQRPYIILKWAETSDRFISPKDKTEKRPVWITNKKSRQLVHKWRAEESSILIGTNTAIEDNPSLTTRDWEGNSPIRLVIDKSLKIPIDANFFNLRAKTIIITEVKKENEKNVIYELIDFSKNIATQIIELIYRYKIQSLIIEGGAKTLQTFIDENLWDEARIFSSNVDMKTGIEKPQLKGQLIKQIHIKSDTLKIIHND